MAALQPHPEGVSLTVRAKPGARRVRVVVEPEQLVVEVPAPPVEGKANAAICEAIAKACGVRPRQVRLLTGEQSRDKVVLVLGIDVDTLAVRLATIAEVK